MSFGCRHLSIWLKHWMFSDFFHAETASCFQDLPLFQFRLLSCTGQIWTFHLVNCTAQRTGSTTDKCTTTTTGLVSIRPTLSSTPVFYGRAGISGYDVRSAWLNSFTSSEDFSSASGPLLHALLCPSTILPQHAGWPHVSWRFGLHQHFPTFLFLRRNGSQAVDDLAGRAVSCHLPPYPAAW